MKMARGLCFGAWLIVTINLLMAFASIGIFLRMAPAIAEIISNNESSLQACESMLTAIALVTSGNGEVAQHRQNFKAALERVIESVTEIEEPAVIKIISENYENVFSHDKNAVLTTTNAILELSRINRNAMVSADKRAQHLGHAGAWGIVFMAIFSFITGLLFIQQLYKRLLEPLEEIQNVLNDHQNGETRRRCAGSALPKEIKGVFTSINLMLDQVRSDFSNLQ